MNYSCAKIGVVVCCFTATVALGDMGVFHAKVIPHELLIRSPQTAKITAEIGAENLYISSVAVYQTTASGRPIANLGSMYDDGTHGDETAADAIFTLDVPINPLAEGSLYFRVTAAYQGVRNRYLSPILTLNIYIRIPEEVVNAAVQTLQDLEAGFNDYLINNDLATARQLVLHDALNNPDITAAALSGENLCTIHEGVLRGMVFLPDPSASPTDGFNPSLLPASYQSPGNNKLLIYAPSYSEGQNEIADYANVRFDHATSVALTPGPPVITTDAAASLDVVKEWGTYGTVILHTHGGYWSVDARNYVVFLTGTEASLSNQLVWAIDLAAHRIGICASGHFVVYPSFITEHCSAMQNTFFYLGACESLKDDSLWNVLQAKGAKVGFGWSEKVYRSFNANTFSALIDSMLPMDPHVVPLTAKQAFDGIPNKCDAHPTPACLQMRVASNEWERFIFYEGGLINGDFETGDWSGWTIGYNQNPSCFYGIISGARKHGGAQSVALGRWDASFHGYDPIAQPAGYEWLYQDFVVPSNVTYLKFDFWMETYDTAYWDWFDAYVMNTNGAVLNTLVERCGKPGDDYGPYWSTVMQQPVNWNSGTPAGTAVGDGWYGVTGNISAYRGEKIRIYFDQRHDSYGYQQRTYVDNVRLE